MVSAEEAFEDFCIDRSATADAQPQRQPGNAMLLRDAAPPGSDWLGMLLGLLGRRVPVRRPALTAGA